MFRKAGNKGLGITWLGAESTKARFHEARWQSLIKVGPNTCPEVDKKCKNGAGDKCKPFSNR